MSAFRPGNLGPSGPRGCQASYTDASDSPLSGAFAEEVPGTDELAEQLVRDADLRAAVDRLPDPLPRLVRLRFGLDGTAPMSSTSVAKVLCLGQQKTRRLKCYALALLREDATLEPAG